MYAPCGRHVQSHFLWVGNACMYAGIASAIPCPIQPQSINRLVSGCGGSVGMVIGEQGRRSSPWIVPVKRLQAQIWLGMEAPAPSGTCRPQKPRLGIFLNLPGFSRWRAWAVPWAFPCPSEWFGRDVDRGAVDCTSWRPSGLVLRSMAPCAKPRPLNYL